MCACTYTHTTHAHAHTHAHVCTHTHTCARTHTTHSNARLHTRTHTHFFFCFSALIGIDHLPNSHPLTVTCAVPSPGSVASTLRPDYTIGHSLSYSPSLKMAAHTLILHDPRSHLLLESLNKHVRYPQYVYIYFHTAHVSVVLFTHTHTHTEGKCGGERDQACI